MSGGGVGKTQGPGKTRRFSWYYFSFVSAATGARTRPRKKVVLCVDKRERDLRRRSRRPLVGEEDGGGLGKGEEEERGNEQEGGFLSRFCVGRERERGRERRTEVEEEASDDATQQNAEKRQ